MSNNNAQPIKNLKWPTNWSEVFLREAPLYLEIGFGNGSFLVQMAKESPQANLIGIEVSIPSIKNCERKIEKARLENIALVRGTAQSALWLLFEKKSINKVFINFPDPWPKPAHHQRRLVSDEFLDLLGSRLAAGSELQIATDHQDYAEWIEDALSRSRFFNHQSVMRDFSQGGERKSTKYELKAIQGGRPCYYFQSNRNEIEVEKDFPIPKENPMPHVVLKSPAGLDYIAGQFKPVRFAKGDTTVRYIACYLAAKGDYLVIDTFIHESPLEQRILLSLARRKYGDFLLSVHEVGFPRSTPGVHQAIEWFAEWVVSLDQESLILRKNLVVS